MSDSAPNNSLDSLSMAGFEYLFETPSITDQALGSTTALYTHATTVLSADGNNAGGNNEGLTLRSASEKLGISPNTIRKRIRLGELQAHKVLGVNGPEWRIKATHDNRVGGIKGANLRSVPASDFTPAIESLLKVIDTQAKQIEAAVDQVRAFNKVISYQQEQLEQKDASVKLLTDSRHGGNWLVKLAYRLKLIK